MDIGYVGCAACFNAAGYVAPVTATSGDVFRGVFIEQIDNSAGDAGDKNAKVIMPIEGLWDCSGLAQSDVGGDCWFSDDHTITTTPGNCFAGTIVELVGTTQCWVNHLPAARTADSFALADSAAAVWGTGSDISMNFDGTSFEIEGAAASTPLLIGADSYLLNVTLKGTLTVGKDDTGHDVKFFGATAGSSLLWDESANSLIITSTVAVGDGNSAIRVAATAAAASNAYGVAAYFDTILTGTTAGHVYGVGSWINTASTPVLSAGHIIVPFEGGVYAGEAQAAARIVFAGQHQAILTGAPASLHAWRLNTTQTITAVIAAANPGSVGFTAGAGTSGTQVGYIPLADIVGTGVVYVRVYGTAT